MNKQLIEDAWISYRKQVITNDAGAIQVKETRQAFFSGAVILWTLILSSLTDDSEPTDEDLELMESIKDELDDYAKTVPRITFTGHGKLN